MPGPEIFAAFYVTAFILALAPGPDIIFVLTQSALFGASAGLATTAGLLTGVLAQTLAVALGVAVIFQTSPLAFTLLKCVGAGYLCWLAWQSFRAGAAIAHSSVQKKFMGYSRLYRRGLIMNLTNPKVVLFFLALLPQFCVPEAGNVALQMVALGCTFILAAFPVFLGASMLGGRLEKKFNDSPKVQIMMHRAAGLIFLCLAAALVFAEAA